MSSSRNITQLQDDDEDRAFAYLVVPTAGIITNKTASIAGKMMVFREYRPKANVKRYERNADKIKAGRPPFHSNRKKQVSLRYHVDKQDRKRNPS